MFRTELLSDKPVVLDANEAVAQVAYACNEVIAIYPITPASPMGEFCDAWANARKPNLFGKVPEVIEMQSEAGAAGCIHGALQAGALATTFTASQGLLLMLPNMYKIAGELSPAVIHVAARTVATHALSIFCDHSDVMAARMTGWAILCSASVQEAQDLALIAQAATLKSRIPFLHFFDGFRTSHELNSLLPLSQLQLSAMLDEADLHAYRQRALTPHRPVIRGTAQNPDVFFQAREACNSYYQNCPSIVLETMRRFAQLTGRSYAPFSYYGPPDATHVAVAMGSATDTLRTSSELLNNRGHKTGVLQVRLYRPFDVLLFDQVLPKTVQRLVVLDRTKEPGAVGEPLYQDVIAALFESRRTNLPKITGGRYGLSSKEFNPAMAQAVFEEALKSSSKNHFTIGIRDDVTHKSLEWDQRSFKEHPEITRAVFWGLGSDGTVGANKNTVKIIGESTSLYAQGYFVYDSKKSGSVTISHLRISKKTIAAPYLIGEADFLACHQFNFLSRFDVLNHAAEGSTFLLNAPYSAAEVWSFLPEQTRSEISLKKLEFYVIDASSVARKTGMGNRINTIMQTCFFALTSFMPKESSIGLIKSAIRQTYAKRGNAIVEQNFAAVDAACAALEKVTYPQEHNHPSAVDTIFIPSEGDFIDRVTRVLLRGKGEYLPVSAFPPDGTFPTSTARLEKRSIAFEIPIWEPNLCIECGLCSLVCPHAAIRMNAYAPYMLALQPDTFRSRIWNEKDHEQQLRMTIQVAPDDCTGCGVCVDVCPARSKERVNYKAINMRDKLEHLDAERINFKYFLSLPAYARNSFKSDSIKGSQLLEPLFEYSGACAGCGETPYLRLLTQLFGDRMLVANATGCSSIYGGNLPTTPWSKNAQGHGPAWANSLFEDNAEFGLGMRMALDSQHDFALHLLDELGTQLDSQIVETLKCNPQRCEVDFSIQRQALTRLKSKLLEMNTFQARALLHCCDVLLKKSLWIIGGDGWAYDIGFGGLDHVLASGRNVNILVLDTEVYSNTGGQASKATPRAAVAKFAMGGKNIGKKDLGALAMAYGNVYVAHVAMGANPQQTIKAFHEAEAYPGPSLIIAYSPCIAHGIDMSTMMSHQKDAMRSGHWPLYRYHPEFAHDEGHPFMLDSRKPSIPFKVFAEKEARFAMLSRAQPEQAARLLALAQKDIDERWNYYEQLSGMARNVVKDESAEAP